MIDPYCVRCNPHGLFGTYEYYVGADCGNHDEPEELGFCIWCNAEDVLDANDMCRSCRKREATRAESEPDEAR